METLTAFIPAGGQGSRLKPHTDETPKPLLLMGDNTRYLIDSSLELTSEVCDHMWVTTDFCAEQVDDYISNNPKVKILHDPRTVGNAGSLLEHLEEISQEDIDGDFLVLPSDHVYDKFDINTFWRQHQDSGADITLMVTLPKGYGEYIETAGGRNSKIVLNPAPNAMSTTGTYIIKNKYLMEWLIGQKKAGWDGELRNINGDIIRPAVGKVDVATYELPADGYWDDAGTILRYFENNMRLSGGKNVISTQAQITESTQLHRCIVLGHAVIGDEVNLSNSIVSVADDNSLHVTSVADSEEYARVA